MARRVPAEGVQARDVEPGMTLSRLGYEYRTRIIGGESYDQPVPRFFTATVEAVEDSAVAWDTASGEACKYITWSDGKSATYNPNERFLP